MVGSHWLMDVFPFVVVSLLPVLRTRLDLTDGQLALLLSTGSVTSGASQPIAAWLSDRFDTRIFGWLGLLVAGICVGLIGYATSFWQLVLLQVIAPIGVGAYHPIAAAGVGRLSGRRRSLGLSIFFLAGMLGGVTGNTMAPAYVTVMSERGAGEPELGVGLRALVWLIPFAMAGALAVWWAIHRVPHRAHDGHERHMTLSEDVRRRRWTAVGVLYAGNVLRFMVNMALVQLIVLWAERRAETRAALDATAAEIGLLGSNINGPLQGAMQIGMGGAGLAAGIVLRARHEKGALVGVPIAGALAVVAFPLASTLDPGGAVDPGILLAFALAITAGAGYGGMIPVTMSLAQRLLPHRTSLASGLMLGGAWCFGAFGPPLASALTNGVGAWGGVGLDWAFVSIGGLLLASGGVALLLHADTIRGAVD